MFVLLQIHSVYAFHFEHSGNGAHAEECIDVLAVDETREGLEEYLAAYQCRFAAACRELEAWDREGGYDTTMGEYEDKVAAIALKYRICLAAVLNHIDNERVIDGKDLKDTSFRIVKCLGPEREQNNSTSVVSLRSRRKVA